VPDSAGDLHEEARNLLAWEDIQDEDDQIRRDDGQKRQLAENVKKAQRDLHEAVWRPYKHMVLLGKDNALQHKDLGLVHFSAASDLPASCRRRRRGRRRGGRLGRASVSADTLTMQERTRIPRLREGSDLVAMPRSVLSGLHVARPSGTMALGSRIHSGSGPKMFCRRSHDEEPPETVEFRKVRVKELCDDFLRWQLLE
jgi:hypothetical protein